MAVYNANPALAPTEDSSSLGPLSSMPIDRSCQELGPTIRFGNRLEELFFTDIRYAQLSWDRLDVEDVRYLEFDATVHVGGVSTLAAICTPHTSGLNA